MSVIKESFFEASFKTIEEFDNAEVAAVSNVGDYAELTIMDIKLDKSVIKTNQEKEHGNATNKQHSKIVSEIKWCS